jgi:hypothetical protein
MSFIVEQMSVSTAEEEQLYFTGAMQGKEIEHRTNTMPAGIYRIVNGSLYRILPGTSDLLEQSASWQVLAER